jgi:hypothetical protein
MTTLLRLLRNRFVWSLPVLLGAVAYGAALMVAQERNSPGAPSQPKSDATHVGGYIYPQIVPNRSEAGGSAAYTLPPNSAVSAPQAGYVIPPTGYNYTTAAGSLPQGYPYGSSGWSHPGGLTTASTAQTYKWVKAEGKKPDWLIRGESAIRARETTRRRLDAAVERDYKDTELSEALGDLLGEIPFYVESKNLEKRNNPIQEQVLSLKAKGTIRSLLSRMLPPLDLDYVVLEDGLMITDAKTAESHGALISYNLSHVANDYAEALNALQTMQVMVGPKLSPSQRSEPWCAFFSPVLFVNAPERVHLEVENALAQIAARASITESTPAPGSDKK